MTLTDVEVIANRGNIATAEFRIGLILRKKVLPEFYREVYAESDPTWARKTATLDTVINTRAYMLPADFQQMVRFDGLKYIGEDAELVLKAEKSTNTGTQGSPEGYYIVRLKKGRQELRLAGWPSQAASYPYVYRSRLVVVDEADDIELDDFIPQDYQDALIEGLWAEILLDRVGQGDPRYGAAREGFLRICDAARTQAHDPARRNYAVYCS